MPKLKHWRGRTVTVHDGSSVHEGEIISGYFALPGKIVEADAFLPFKSPVGDYRILKKYEFGYALQTSEGASIRLPQRQVIAQRNPNFTYDALQLRK